ncbi:conserved hypothetical protein [Talaromyces stipitatus ATCC 10500]|uniref:Methyltransferase domain-containing protein n=1 Tax=Talaromyces stipitatus (strain ATCC 10500 / CBS 375.48 / QM 6759 / NRRL 1006) TaxID=441959 RepID=B8MAI1_TALSN|nr:uncharacterized protein TSTA_112390 [Talaromyces stipitatus ATCC 10500]EED17405.1 conserved hypothetical protein [Talaromyces stipitatus ATCC 10500]
MAPSDLTFTTYTATQAQTYAQTRLSYPRKLYDTVINHHTSTGGNLNVLADVGCGPGRATRDLAASFKELAIGLDPGVEMIEAARRLCEESNHRGCRVEFAVCAAEDCARGIRDVLFTSNGVDGGEEGSVDLLTAAMAAHWFSMSEFWAQAARVVKPNGTVALWTCSSLYCHPSTPNAPAVQKVLFHLERDVLAPYELPSNRISRDMYTDLTLPWQVNKSLAESFPESAFVRLEWDKDGVLSDGNEFFSTTHEGKKGETTLNDLAASLGTASMVTRWRKANPDLVGTERDCVRKMCAEVKRAIGVSADENPTLKVGTSVVLLLFKRK